MDKSTKLLEKLVTTIVTTHLDMGGKNRYALSVSSWPIIDEIKRFLCDQKEEI